MAQFTVTNTTLVGTGVIASTTTRRPVRSETGYLLCKRAIDIVGATCALLVLAPVIALVALWIRLDSAGPAFFSQVRVGEGKRDFRCWKLRSMYIDAEQRKAELEAQNEMNGGVLFKMKHDPRITRVGRFIRKASIDELPQLWNVLCGDMSLVGPRPAIPSEVAQYTAYECGRLQVKPGITCLWQISGRSELPFDRQVALDIDYANQRSVMLDLRILVRTVPAVLTARGAY